MKKILRALGLFLLLSSSLSWADTCPRLEEFTPNHAPAGWTFLIPPMEESFDGYHFDSAIHSQNGSFYYLQVICRYVTCPTMLCPAFTLISNNTYEQPSENTPPWNHRSVLKYTLTCMPGDHNPAHCTFQ